MVKDYQLFSDLDASVNDSVMSSSSQPVLFEPGPSGQQGLTTGHVDVSTNSLEVAAVGGNETDEDKLKDTASSNVLRLVFSVFNPFPNKPWL